MMVLGLIIWHETYIIENSCPSLHGNALEDGENSKQDVVELGDTVVGADPGVVAVILLWTLPHAACKRQLWWVNSLIVYAKRTQKHTACTVISRCNRNTSFQTNIKPLHDRQLYLGCHQTPGRCDAVCHCRTQDQWWQTWGWRRTREGRSGEAVS